MEEGDTSIDSIPSDTEQQTHCSPQRCVDINDQNVLWCLKCKRAVHFKCTNIPAYHIQAIINKSKHKRFTCINCIEVSAEILELTKKPEPVNQEIIQIKNDVKRTENIVKAQRETINKQNTEIIQLQRNVNGNNILEVEERLKGIITSKIDELQRQFHHCQRQTKQSFADVVNQPAPSSLKNIIKEAKNEEERETLAKTTSTSIMLSTKTWKSPTI